MKWDDYFQRLEDKMDKGFERVEDKLDNHLSRLSKAEEAIVWMRGHLKISTTIVMSVIVAAITAYFKWN